MTTPKPEEWELDEPGTELAVPPTQEEIDLWGGEPDTDPDEGPDDAAVMRLEDGIPKRRVKLGKALTSADYKKLEHIYEFRIPHKNRFPTILEEQMHKRLLRFLYELSTRGSVLRAAIYAGYQDTSQVQKWRKKSPEFAAAWEIALAAAADIVEDTAWKVGVEGVFEAERDKDGNVVGYKRVRSQKILEVMLKRHKPEYREKIENQVTHNHKVGVALIPTTIADPKLWEQAAKQVQLEQNSQIIDITPEEVVDITPKVGQNPVKVAR